MSKRNRSVARAAWIITAGCLCFSAVAQNEYPRPSTLQHGATGCAVTQATNVASGIGFFRRADLSRDGRFLAVMSHEDLVPGVPNGNENIFVLDLVNDTAVQLTNSDDVMIDSHLKMGDRLMVFAAELDLIPGQNPDGGWELFSYDPYKDTLSQLTNDISASHIAGASINDNDTKITFLTNGTPDGTTNPFSRFNLFLYDVPTQTFTRLTENPASAGGSLETVPRVSLDGSVIAVQLGLDLLGSDGVIGPEIYVYTASDGELTRLTDTEQGPFSVRPPVMDDEGRYVAFTAYGDQTGENPDGGAEVFLYDVQTTELTQITNSTTRDNFVFAMTADATLLAVQLEGIFGFFEPFSGRFTPAELNAEPPMSFDLQGNLSFLSRSNLTGGNADGSAELFVADCSDLLNNAPADIPTLSQWGSMALLVLLGLSGLTVLRFRS